MCLELHVFMVRVGFHTPKRQTTYTLPFLVLQSIIWRPLHGASCRPNAGFCCFPFALHSSRSTNYIFSVLSIIVIILMVLPTTFFWFCRCISATAARRTWNLETLRARLLRTRRDAWSLHLNGRSRLVALAQHNTPSAVSTQRFKL